MRIAIDLQVAQGAQRFGQAGRDALSLALAIARGRGEHQVIVVLNALFPDTIEPLRAAFDQLVPQQDIRLWHSAGPLGACEPDNHARARVAEGVREAFFASLAPDVVLVCGLFDGFADDAVSSVAAGIATAVLVHDLRPLRDPAMTLEPEPGLAAHFQRQLDHLRRADLALALEPGVARDAALLGLDALDLSGGDPDQPAAQRWDDMALRAYGAFGGMTADRHAAATAPEDPLAALIAGMPALMASAPPAQLRMWAHCLSRFPDPAAPRQLFVDVSELVQRDARTGVQRVTRSILKQLIEQPPAGYTVQPVHASGHRPGYRYARHFTAGFLGIAPAGDDDPIDYQPDDVFLGLDLLPHILPAQRPFLESLRRDGVQVWCVVYDLLPVLMPSQFPAGADEGHSDWLDAVCAFDGAVCISQAVADELAQWQRAHTAPRLRPFSIGWFHLGADVDSSAPSRGLPDDAAAVLEQLALRPTFIGVGTIEPRKRYDQLLAACELLWEQGTDVNLVMLGKQGWMVDEFAQRVLAHGELGRRLFWLNGASDDYLARVYGAADALVAASAGEGFGLPLIEAAQHGVPLIARDLPVFREVGGDNAFYFSGEQPADLAAALRQWLALHEGGAAPSPAGLKWLTWADSRRQLMEVVLGQAAGQQRLIASAAARAPTRPCVLLLSPYPLRRPRHGGQLRAAAMAKTYRAAGFEVHEVGFYQEEAYEQADIGPHDIAFPADSRFRRYLGQPMPALSDFLMGPFAVAGDSVFRRICASLPEKVDVIQLEQPWLYPLARWLQLEAPQCRAALLVNSTNNIEAPMKRAMLEQSFSATVVDHAVQDMAAIEREVAREAALSLGVTMHDAEVLRGYGARDVLHAANGISPWRADQDRRAQWRERLPHQPWPIFIASAHPPNFTGFIDAVGDSLACIPEGSKLVVAGGVGPHLERALAQSRWSDLNLARLQVLGVLDDADLAAVKSLAHAFLLPIGAGGGSNIKTAEALYSGRPLVATSTALRGFEQFRDLPEVTVADSPAAFQAAIRSVLERAPDQPADAAPSALRDSVTWDACLAAVPVEVARLLAARKEKT